MVKLKNCNIQNFSQIIKYKRLFCFGSGRQAEGLFVKYKMLHLEETLCGFIDNDKRKQGTRKLIGGRKIPIYSFDEFVEMVDAETIVLTTSTYCPYMIEQMDRKNALDGFPCYIDFLVENTYSIQAIQWKKNGEMKIPKTIHYCWFGKNPIPDAFCKYMQTWQDKCPDYQIVRWDESNYDVNNSDYIREAYKHKKWAFVSDFARLDIIYRYGGIYLDTDVELLKNLDSLLYDEFFCGFEQNNYVNFGLGFGAVKGHPIVENLLRRYQKMKFELEDGSLNETACAVFQLEEIQNQGFQTENRFQRQNSCALYPSEVFAPHDLLGLQSFITENTVSIHHYSSTWWNKSAEISMDYLRTKLKEYRERIENYADKRC